MTTQVSFTTDQKLKRVAMQKAKQQGITLKAVMVFALKGYVEGKIVFGMNTLHPDVEELQVTDKELIRKSQKIAKLLLKRKV